MKRPRNLSMLFSLWGVASTASAAVTTLRAGRRDGDRVALVHGVASALVAATTAAMFVKQWRKDRQA